MQVEDRPVCEEATPLGIESNQIQVLFDLLACLGEDATEHGGHGEDGRPLVEAKALFFQAGGLAAQPVDCVRAGPLNNRGRPACTRQPRPPARRRSRLPERLDVQFISHFASTSMGIGSDSPGSRLPGSVWTIPGLQPGGGR